MKRILVTGGAGFIGSHLCERLLDLGHEVICLDNYFTGSKMNIIHLLNNPYFEMIRHDVTMPLFVETDEIYNLGAQSHVKVSFEVPEFTADVVACGTLRLLEAMRRTGVKCRFYQASSSEEFGRGVGAE